MTACVDTEQTPKDPSYPAVPTPADRCLHNIVGSHFTPRSGFRLLCVDKPQRSKKAWMAKESDTNVTCSEAVIS